MRGVTCSSASVVSDKTEFRKKKRRRNKEGARDKAEGGAEVGEGGITDLRCHLLYEVDGVIYVEADHTAQWNLW